MAMRGKSASEWVAAFSSFSSFSNGNSPSSLEGISDEDLMHTCSKFASDDTCSARTNTGVNKNKTKITLVKANMGFCFFTNANV